MLPFQIIGILNVTPDSYFDGGKYNSVQAALERAGEMLRQGADIIEIGGESTGPNSKDVPLEEEINRTIPVLKEIVKRWGSSQIIIDTYKSEVARKAIEAGATMINDVTAGRGDSEMFSTVAEFHIPHSTFHIPHLVLMYAKDSTPRTTVQPKQYVDVVATVKKFLSERLDAAAAAGIPKDRIILDPGLGHFVSGDPKYSFEIIARLREFQDLGCPLLLSPSRKSFLAGPANVKTANRLPGTIAASAIAVMNGASYIRTHDVLEVKRAVEVAEAIFNFLLPPPQ